MKNYLIVMFKDATPPTAHIYECAHAKSLSFVLNFKTTSVTKYCPEEDLEYVTDKLAEEINPQNIYYNGIPLQRKPKPQTTKKNGVSNDKS